jgi:shikimate kinase
MKIDMFHWCSGEIAENKDVAKRIREEIIVKHFDKENITIDFKDIDITTQSFVHALISSVFRNNGEKSLDKIEFANCNKAVKSIIATVINYSLE